MTNSCAKPGISLTCRWRIIILVMCISVCCQRCTAVGWAVYSYYDVDAVHGLRFNSLRRAPRVEEYNDSIMTTINGIYFLALPPSSSIIDHILILLSSITFLPLNPLYNGPAFRPRLLPQCRQYQHWRGALGDAHQPPPCPDGRGQTV